MNTDLENDLLNTIGQLDPKAREGAEVFRNIARQLEGMPPYMSLETRMEFISALQNYATELFQHIKQTEDTIRKQTLN